MNDNVPFIQKELSWLAFNERVLQEAADKKNALIERIRFLGIYANNLDEFYKVQFANLKRELLIKQEQGYKKNIKSTLKQVKQKVIQNDLKFDALYNELLLEMARNQIYLINEKQLTAKQEEWLKRFYQTKLKHLITPIILNENTNLIQVLKDDHSYLAVEIVKNDQVNYALIELPTDHHSRFVTLPSEANSKNQSIIFLDNIIRFCLADIFDLFFEASAYNAYSIKINRDAEYELSSELDSLLELMSQGLKKRLTAQPVRFIYQQDMPKAFLSLLLEELQLSESDAMAGTRYPNLKDLINFPKVGSKKLYYKKPPHLVHKRLTAAKCMFDAIKQKDVLLYYPFYSFRHVLELMRQASFDPYVTHIRLNIYRVARDSHFVEAAINAANNGKKVTVVVELQARFDEATNIHWAKKLNSHGVKVIYSQTKLKIHAKLFVIDRNINNKIERYAHIGTGNFNEKTADVYTDFALLTANPLIADEVLKVFKFIENPFKPVHFDHLLVSPQNTRSKFVALVDREINNAKLGLKSGISLKINAMTDTMMIEKLYEASKYGVKVRLIIRGTCVLVPQIKDFSENIYVTSIVDSFLEHARVYIFENNGDKETYIASADWMPRNIDNRVEVGVKILDPNLQKILHDIFNIQAKDNVKARIIDKDLKNQYVQRTAGKMVRSQVAIYDYLNHLSDDI